MECSCTVCKESALVGVLLAALVECGCNIGATSCADVIRMRCIATCRITRKLEVERRNLRRRSQLDVCR